jgi:hypothetical protein
LYGDIDNYVWPRDDAPRIAEVHRDHRTGTVLSVGIARPRRLLVLYPWHGNDVLSTGAVVPYYEFAGKARLTDEGWKALLDSDDCPAVPSWFAPLVSGGALKTAEPGDID